MPLVKSHSNYVLKSKHQQVNDGTIFERDITTIGAVNQFAPGQTPIYRSGNFIISIRDDRKSVNQYNTQKWEKSLDGDTWTLATIENMVSGDETQDDTKIVLKNDYYDFRDFAYYGSMTELFRSSLADIVDRFPGELYTVSGVGEYYTSSYTEDFETISDRVRVGGETYYIISNPFGINIHTIKKPIEAGPLKYFADGGYENYEIYVGDSTTPVAINTWNVTAYTGTYNRETKKTKKDTYKYVNGVYSSSSTTIVDGAFPCSGDKIADIKINTYTFYAYLIDNNEVVYLHNNNNGIHIRPKKKPFIDDFYNGCNNFQRIILNDNTTPKYKAIFSVIKENNYGYYRELETFVFPTSYGNYNPSVTDSYINRLVEIGEYYDEFFTDNLYRSMTHEAIKNFDWTYTKEYNPGDELEYVAGGQKIEKALRIFAREFDEIKMYIDNIKNVGRITYDERGNVPDYFLTDKCEEDGWDIKSIIPFQLSGITSYSNTTNLLNNKVGKHEYSQSSNTEVTPYSADFIEDGTKNGYFLDCKEGSGISCYLNDWYGSKIRKANDGETQSIGETTGRLYQRVKSYTDENKYTYLDVNNAFLRRLKLNSREIWRSKGTLEGIEMILGMFGLKSKRWLDRNENSRYSEATSYCSPSTCETVPDYEITEYTSFTNRIEETWDTEHQMYHIDWINSTKTITYDYRSVSNYNLPGSQGANYVPYQGIPVSYRDEYEGYGDSRYIAGVTDAYGNKVPKRYLYPSFNSYEQLDGNPYFQMDGGWLSKTIGSNKTPYQNFQFDVNDDIVHVPYQKSGYTEEDGFVVDNEVLYKETVRSIKRVENLNELISLPQMSLYDGIICYVANIGKDIAIIDGQVFDIYHEGDKRYISLRRAGGFIQIGDKYFDDAISIYNKSFDTVSYTLDDKFDGYEIKAYIKSDSDFICYSTLSPDYGISSFQVINPDSDETYTNYYLLKDVTFSDNISITDGRDGWLHLAETDTDYKKINTIYNYYMGNNGHNGRMKYDSGHEYFTYFKRLFKHAYDNDLFDSRCYSNGFVDVYDEVLGVGFKNLIEDNEEIKQYTRFLSADTKVHYFGNYKTKSNGNNANQIHIYGDSHRYAGTSWTDFYGSNNTISYYDIGGGVRHKGEVQPHSSTDDVTNQIMNNKRFKITFFMRRHMASSSNDTWKFNSKEGQIQLKYIDDIVMNYLTQLIPSTVIVDVEYDFCGFTNTDC